MTSLSGFVYACVGVNVRVLVHGLAEGRVESEAMTYCNLEYSEAQLCRIWA